MNRKILKILISLLFLVVAAVAAILSIKSFFPELLEQVKYGVKRIVGEPARKTPAFKKDNQEQNSQIDPVQLAPVENAFAEGRKYGVAPVQVPPYKDMRSKYGVAPVQRQNIDAFIPGSNEDIYTEAYGVAPIDYEEELLKQQNLKKDK